MIRTIIALVLVVLSALGLAVAQETRIDTRTGSVATEFGEDGEVIEDEIEVREPVWLQRGTVTLRGLDKITGRSTDFIVTVDENVPFGSLIVSLDVCYQKPPEEPPESAAFLRIEGTRPMDAAESDDTSNALFSGWMFASSPGLSALEHPVYDVWVIECEAPAVPQDRAN